MIPVVLPWMKKNDCVSGLEVTAGDIRTLVTVAIKAAQCQIFRNSLSMMFLCDDVINLERQLRILARELAVLAASIGATPYQFDSCSVHLDFRP